MHKKFLKKRLEWYKKRSIFVKWIIQNNSDALGATHMKRKNENNLTSVKINSFTEIKRHF